MKLVAVAKLLPTPAQADALRATMERFNAACDWLAGEAFGTGVTRQYDMHGLHYRALRERFGLSAQMAVRALSKVADCFSRDKAKRPRFKPLGAVPYDQRIYSFKALDRVSILTLTGRALIPFVAGAYHGARLDGRAARGQADLVLRRGKFYLYVTVEVPDGAPVDPEGWLGVDLGIRNLATDSDGERHSGAAVDAARVRIHTLRSALQSAGTKSAKRHLKKLAGKEARFRSHTNHVLSKALVTKAQDTDRGLALEDLRGIRGRTRFRKPQRAQMGSWAFFQLRAFLTYKAQRAGVALVVVRAAYTSQTCPECGHCARANRRSQAEFVCTSCGFASHADHVGARNVARRAPVIAPTVRVVEAGNEDSHSTPRRDYGQSIAL